MANRRMFSLKIIDTDEFMDMSQTAQLLYYNLAMRADDDGFVANPKRIMKMTGINDDDFKVLIVKKYIIPFEKGICVIRHWRIHNYIRSDRYIPTNYALQKKQLKIKETGEYELENKENGIPDVIPKVSTGKDRLGKDRLGKDSIKQAKQSFAGGNEINELIDMFKAVNPNYQSLFGNKTERQAIEWIVKQHGVDKIKQLLEKLPKIVSQPFAPKITKPTELKRDLGKLLIFVKQKSQKKEDIGVVKAY